MKKKERVNLNFYIDTDWILLKIVYELFIKKSHLKNLIPPHNKMNLTLHNFMKNVLLLGLQRIENKLNLCIFYFS